MEALTNVHCLARHQLTKRELIVRHGSPKYVVPRIDREVQDWIRGAQIISRGDFEVAQAAARSVMKGRG